MDGLQGHIRQAMAMAMAGAYEAQTARTLPATVDAGLYSSVLEQMKVERDGSASGALAAEGGVSFRPDESRWWNL